MIGRGGGIEKPTALKFEANLGIFLDLCRTKAAVISWSVKGPIRVSEGDFGRFW